MARRLASLAAVAALALTLSACTSGGQAKPSSTGGAAGSISAGARGTVVLVTHDSFVISDALIAEFTSKTGYTLEQHAPGDVGVLVNQLVLTKDAPIGDVTFGIDNTFASRAVSNGVLAAYRSPAEGTSAAQFDLDSSHNLTPIDYGDVCVNVDHGWFSAKGIPEPVTLADLAKPAYQDLLAVENPATSSPGLAFLLATVSAFGADGWQGYWSQLKTNGVKIDAGWTDAYTVDFSGSSGKGSRPLVVSYASSPPDEVPAGGTTAPTGALLDTCFRQVEYAGVLTGAKNPAGAKAFIDFMLGDSFQAALPSAMYVYPVSSSVKVPDTWATFAPIPSSPFSMDPAQIDKNRDGWIQKWTDTVIG
jgi:thiamine transport system substrate-binding protein